MVKMNKIPFFVLLGIALAFFAATLLFLFIPEPTPVKMTEEFRIVETENGYAVCGKIRNDTDEELTFGENRITRLEVTAIIKDNISGNEREFKFELFKEQIPIPPHTEYEFVEEINIYDGCSPVRIKSVRGYANGSSGFALYGNIVNDGMFSIIALFSGIIGVIFLIIAIVDYSVEKKNAKVANNVIQQIKSTLGNGILVSGQFGNKAKNRAATAKTTASVVGAVISATIFGVGRYTVYGKSSKTDFILTDTSIYTFFRHKYNNITNEVKSALINPVITEKKGNIYITGDTKYNFLTIKLSKDATKNAEILQDLQHIFGVGNTENQ